MDEEAQLRRLHRLSRLLRGPLASIEVRQQPLVASSSCSQVLKFWPLAPEHHLLKLVIDSAQEHLDRVKDAGWLYVQLSLGLYRGLQGCGGALEALARASVRLEQGIQELRVPFDLKLAEVLDLLRSVLCKPVAFTEPAAVQHISVALLEAFLHVGPGMDQGLAWPEVVRFEWFCGHDVDWSWTHHGILLDTPASLGHPKAGRLRLVLFDASLEQWLSSGDAWGAESYAVETMLSASSSVDALRSWEISQFKKLADSLLEAKVDVLACQKLVDPWLLDYLQAQGVSVLWRLSIRHVEVLRRFTGATPVTSLAALPAWQEVLGHVDELELRHLGSRDYVLVSATDPPVRVSTVLVSAPDEQALEEMKHCLPQALHCLWHSVLGGFVLPGGGLTELQLARDVEQLQIENPSVAVALKAVAACFQDAAVSLAVDHPGGSVAVLDDMTLALETWKQAQHVPGIVFDAESAKLRSILGAVNLASILLRIRCVWDFRTSTIG